METNVLYYGDNLDVLRKHIPDESVDLIYLDPPFNSNRSYNVLFRETSAQASQAQIEAFEDTWHWGKVAQDTFEQIALRGHDNVAKMLQAMVDALDTNDFTAYLTMMAVRLVELRRVLKDSGSIYLHCDPTASHYLKVLMDSIFGPKNFRNEIVWRRSLPHGNVSKSYGRIHDLILFYVKDAAIAKWEPPHVSYVDANGKLRPEVEERVLSQYNMVEEATGRRFQATSLLNPNPDRPNLTYEFLGHTKVWRWTRDRMEKAYREGQLYIPRDGKGVPREKRYLDEQEGFPLQDIWYDIPTPPPTERLGYPTQKPLALLERIVGASSNEGDVVLDPFCGCGTAVHAAHKLGRRWVGIDITHLAIGLIRRRMQDAFPGLEVRAIGEPVDVNGARALMAQDAYQFQWWALGQLGGVPQGGDRKKGADRGIDGVIPFLDGPAARRRVIVSVKGGGTGVAHVRDLKGVLEREKEPIAVLLTLQPPTREMLTEAVAAGSWRSDFWQRDYPRVQIITVEEMLAGARVEMPPQTSAFAQAQREADVTPVERPQLL